MGQRDDRARGGLHVDRADRAALRELGDALGETLLQPPARCRRRGRRLASWRCARPGGRASGLRSGSHRQTPCGCVACRAPPSGGRQPSSRRAVCFIARPAGQRQASTPISSATTPHPPRAGSERVNGSSMRRVCGPSARTIAQVSGQDKMIADMRARLVSASPSWSPANRWRRRRHRWPARHRSRGPHRRSRSLSIDPLMTPSTRHRCR